MAYAKETTVPVSKTRLEIEFLLKEAGATEYIQGNSGLRQAIAFTLHDKKYRMVLDIPGMDAPEVMFTPTKIKRNKTAAEAAQKQLERSRWRALYIIIKAKLVAVESGITTFEQEFRDSMMLPNGATVGEFIGPQIEEAYLTGKIPPLLPMY